IVRSKDGIGAQVGEVRQRDQLLAQVGRTAVEVVVAQRIGGQPHHVQYFHGGLVTEEVGNRRRSSGCVPAVERDDSVLGFCPIEIQPRLQERGAANTKAGIHSPGGGQVIGSLCQRRQLPMEVADVQNRAFLVLPGRGQ